MFRTRLPLDDWPVAMAGVLCTALAAASGAEHLPTAAPPEHIPPAPAPVPETVAVPYAPAPGRDDRTPVEYLSQVFGLGDPALAATLSGVGPVFWAPGGQGRGQGTGALIAEDVVLTTAHLFVKDGTWKGGSALLPVPPDPKGGSIYLAACKRAYRFAAIELGSETPRRVLGLDYALARLSEPACPEARPLEIGVIDGTPGTPVLNMGSYPAEKLARYRQHPLQTGKRTRDDGLHRYHVFGVLCQVTGIEDGGAHPNGLTGLVITEGCDGVPGGSGGPLLARGEGERSWQIVGVANSYRPNTEYNNYTQVIGAFAAHLGRWLPDLRLETGAALATNIAATPATGPWIGLGEARP